MHEQSSMGRQFGPAFIAVLVVLAATAATIGYVVARQVLTTPAATANQPTDGPDGGPTDGPTGGPATAPDAPGSSPTQDPPGDPSAPGPGSSGQSCPPITIDAVRAAGLAGDFTLLLYVDGAGPRAGGVGAEVWICAGADGTLVYQGHRKSGPFTAATSEHTILLGRGILGKVEREEGGFVATNPKDPTNVDDPTRTEYHVSRTGITLIDRPGDRTTVYPAISVFPLP